MKEKIEIDKDFVPYEEALALRDLGYDLNKDCLKLSKHTKVCEEQAKPEGCQLHNLHCGYPDCTIDKTIEPIGLPLYQQAFRWFREKHELANNINQSTIYQELEAKGSILNYGIITDYRKGALGNVLKTKTFLVYEEAELACLKELIKLVKSKV